MRAIHELKMAQGWCQIVDVANLCDGFLDVD